MAFADLTGFTRLGESVDASELGALAESFAELAADLAVPPVRLVKTVGDAVMLVSPDTDALISMLLDLHDATEAEDSGLPPIHAGVARGPALGRGGDVYGAAVNKASRIAQFARPGSVLAAGEVRDDAERRLRLVVRRPPPAQGPDRARGAVPACAAPPARGAGRPRRGAPSRSPRPAAWRSASTLSVFSQVKSLSSRPKWP